MRKSLQNREEEEKKTKKKLDVSKEEE